MHQDSVCGRPVNEATALHAQRNGKLFYFCSDYCHKKFFMGHASLHPQN
ncbi:MAG: YHS domain-containing protein [Phycisphaerae bacterium]